MIRRDDGKHAVLARALAAEGRKEAFTRLAEDHDGLGVLMGGGNERSEVRSLVVSAEQHDRTRRAESREGLKRRVDVGRLGVVVAGHTGNAAAGLDAMLKRREGVKRLGDERIVNAERERARRRDKRVLRVVIALDMQLGRSAQPMLHAPKRDREHAIGRDKGGVLESAAGTHVTSDPVFGADGDIVEAALVRRHGA